MSGIVGIVNLDGAPVDRLLLARMTDYLAFRGPDAQETWSQGPVGLGHALLRTVDDTRPDCQPLTLNGRVWIVADARVDGRDELRQKLRGHGCRDLEEATDAELILQSYLLWGEACVQHLIGDFAFAIWDEPRRRLFAARDHFGIKPFYYARVGNCLIFSNTLNCLRMHPDVSDELNDLAIADFLLFEFNQDLATTTFIDIKSLPPAHCLVWQQGRLDLSPYWTLPMPPTLRYQRGKDYVEHFRELLQQAVADRLRTSCIGVLMSGGMDSSSVAAFALELGNRRSVPFDLQAYTQVYDSLIPDEERHYSGLVATHLNIPIRYHVIDDYQLYERWDQPELHRPMPHHAPLETSWVDLLKMVVGRNRLVMTGQGPDIIFCASDSYLDDLLKSRQWGRVAKEIVQGLQYRRRPPLGLRRRLLPWRYQANVLDFPGWLNQSFADRLDLKARWDRLNNPPLPASPLRKEAFSGLASPCWPDYWQKHYDPGVTGLPVEFCHPYFDLRVVNYSLALPEWPWCLDKLLSREVGRGLLPEAVRTRPKAPLAGFPELEVIRQSGGSWINGFEPSPDLHRYVNVAAIPSLTNEMDFNNVNTIYLNLRVFTLNFWLNNLPEKVHRS
jgi:asparagine synthase (glutamine-hydrolysing)